MATYKRASWKCLLALSIFAEAVHASGTIRECPSNPAGLLAPKITDKTCPLIVDDETAAFGDSWEPWVHAPICVKARSRQHGKLCAYTYTGFRGESGIGIVTTPELAANSISVLEDRDQRWLPAQAQTASTTPAPYVIEPVEGKGLGVKANRSIREGEIIMIDKPLILRLIDYEDWELRDVVTVLNEAANSLPREDRRTIVGMAQKTGGGDLLSNVLNTNAFSVFLGGEPHSGLYSEVARINHACKPNAFFRFSRGTLAGQVVAYRDIEQDEEISISYLPMNLVSAVRREEITRWGFNCSCSLCTASSESTEVSDSQRRRIHEILGLLKISDYRNLESVGSLARETFDLCEKEGMNAQTGDFHGVLARVYTSIGQKDLARKHATLAIETLSHYVGFDSARAETEVQFLKRLETGYYDAYMK